MPNHSLKAKNLKFVVIILLLDTVVFLITFLPSSKIILLQMLEGDLPLRLIKSGTIISITSVAALLINHLLPPSFKAGIVFWRLWNALPGCRAFSKLAHHDPRIDIQILQKKLGSLPTNPKEQNVLWYRLFKQHESSITIKEAHQRFLFFRDITSMTLLMLGMTLSLIIVCLGISSINTYKYVLAFIIGQYFLSMIAARNTAIRLVQNVLALESATTKLTKRPKK